MANTGNLQSPLDMLYQWEKQQPNKIFIHQPLDGGVRTFTWQAFGEEVRRLAAAIKDMNLPPKSTIALISKNCAHWFITDLAIMMSGHTSVPIYPNLGSETLNYILDHSESKLLFVGKLDDWDKMKGGVPAGLPMVSFPWYGPKGAAYTTWEDFTKGCEPITENVTRNLDDIMSIIYTSGTTGKPKGVVHKFRALSFAIHNALTAIDLPNDSRFFSYLPLCHIAERMLVEMGSLYTGSTVYFAESLATFAKNLQDASPTIFLGVPRIWTKFQMKILEKMPQSRLNLLLAIPILNNFIRRKIKASLGLSKTVYPISGAAPISSALLEWYKKLGINIQEAYGMTENCAYSHYTRKGKIKIGSVGQAMPKADVKLGDDGEILVKSEANMVGYYKEPAKTAAAFLNGYLRTGDQGKIDKQGYLRITGRVKDIFKTEKGKYVAPNPIEKKLSKNTYLEQICVVGTNLPQPIAMVVLSEEARGMDRMEVVESLETLLKEVNPLLDKHEKLKKIVVLKEPWTVENGCLTPTLKVKRNPLEAKYQNKYAHWYKYDSTVVWI